LGLLKDQTVLLRKIKCEQTWTVTENLDQCCRHLSYVVDAALPAIGTQWNDICLLSGSNTIICKSIHIVALCGWFNKTNKPICFELTHLQKNVISHPGKAQRLKEVFLFI